MSRTALLLAVVLALAGCVGGLGPTSPTTGTTTEAPPTASHEPVRVHYVLDVGGEALDEFRSVNVTIRSIAFREGTEGQCHGPLYPVDASPTPTRTPDMDEGLDCLVFETNRTLDLTEHRDPVSLGVYTVPAVVADDSFVVSSENGTLKNGTQVQFAPDSPGVAVWPTGSGEIQRIGLSVENYSSNYGVGPGGVGTAVPAPTVEYAVDDEGRISRGESVTVSVSRDGSPLSDYGLTVDDRLVTTGSDGSVTVDVENARVFGIRVPVTGSA